jgi:IS30 family transposase
MGRKPKPAEVRAVFFTARASGATLREAAAAAGVCRTTGHYWLAQSGGARPRLVRPRPPLRLSLDEREAISRGLAARKTFTTIAAELGRAVTTITREVARNSGPNGYRAVRADRLAVARTARPRAGKLADHPALRAVVEDKLTLCWSPRQISRHLERTYPHDPTMRVSHETIYTSLFVQAKGVLRPGADRAAAHQAGPPATATADEPGVATQPDPEHARHRRTPGRGSRPVRGRALGG